MCSPLEHTYLKQDWHSCTTIQNSTFDGSKMRAFEIVASLVRLSKNSTFDENKTRAYKTVANDLWLPHYQEVCTRPVRHVEAVVVGDGTKQNRTSGLDENSLLTCPSLDAMKMEMF